MKNQKKRNLKTISILALLLTDVIWGAAFVAQAVGMEYVGPWTFVFFRYVLSALILIPLSVITSKRLRRKQAAREAFAVSEAPAASADSEYTAYSSAVIKARRKEYLKGGAICGLFLCFASISQQAGIQYTTAGKAGFITALYVVLVPVLGLILGMRPPKRIWVCVAAGIAGLYLISVKSDFSVQPGDSLVMLCALLFACQILSIDHFSARLENSVLLANLQFAMVAVISFAGMLIFEHPVWEDILAAAVPILYAGILSGAVGYTLQIVAQKNIEPSVASLLMSMESVFSALAGWVILGQSLSLKELAGCALVLAAVLAAQIPVENITGKRKKRE